MASSVYDSDFYKDVETKVQDLINKYSKMLSSQTINSPRSIGDSLQDILSDEFQAILGDKCKDFSTSVTRRSLEDLKFTDTEGYTHWVDVKTHNLDTKFSMPNLISVKRLAELYKEDSNYFALLLIDYKVQQGKLEVTKVMFFPIEFLSWESMSIGALGWGQLQITDSNRVKILDQNCREKWIGEFKTNVLRFYRNEMNKIGQRVTYFEAL
ncbi:hypothetical protein [Heliorestis convoluta]|nr:hypothetical protein [Heliorestis convoluta]